MALKAKLELTLQQQRGRWSWSRLQGHHLHSDTAEHWSNTFLEEQVVTILSASGFLSRAGSRNRRQQQRENPNVRLDSVFCSVGFILARLKRLPPLLCSRRAFSLLSLPSTTTVRRMLAGAGCVSSSVATSCYSDGPELIGRRRWWWRSGETYEGTERVQVCLHGSLHLDRSGVCVWTFSADLLSNDSFKDVSCCTH